MKYYVVADVHGFYTELYEALEEQGFFADKEPHKLIVCGDLLDRGGEAIKIQSFIEDLINKDEVILIRGNHEDLLVDLVENSAKWMARDIMMTHHWRNGTVDSLMQLTGGDLFCAVRHLDEMALKAKNTPFYKTVLPNTLNYYETKNHIFVHGWIPCTVLGRGTSLTDTFIYESDWRSRQLNEWDKARWLNGMAAAYNKVIEPNKTIVCGHWHTSYGHSAIEGKCSEFGEDADFSPYTAKGIIALDACTVHSHKVNCIIIEDEPLNE